MRHDQRVGIRAFNPHKHSEEIAIGKILQQLGVIGKVDRCFGRKLERKAFLILPSLQVRQEFPKRLFVADQVVIDKIDMPAITKGIKRIQFCHDLFGCFCARHTAIQFDDVTEFATERTSA